MATSEITEFYKDRSVLVTGATGFMGKVLVEKLLRSCPGIKTIYMLMRSKGGSDIKTRLEELSNIKIFEKLKMEQPEFINKLVPISGDIMSQGLGISDSDVKLLSDSVSVVFHAAATVKFDEPLKMSVAMNIQGTKHLVELCHKMTNLVSLVHVSTAYCHCNREEVNELVYPPPTDPHKLIDTVEWLEEDLVNKITPELLGSRPNTYTYTKALAEHLLLEEGGSLPIAIVRPSIVTAAWREPIPGWVDNLNGPTGLIAGAGKGVLRTAYCHRDMVADLVPVDIPINLMIAVAWFTATARPNSVLVYNCASGSLNRVTWGDVQYWGYRHLIQNPMNDVVWYPSGHFKSNRLWNSISVVFNHYIPAYVFDFFTLLAGKKPMLVKIQTKLSRAIDCLEYFMTHEWKFSSDNVCMLLDRLSEEDKNIFNFDIRSLHWPTYLEQLCLGTRRFVMKEELSTLPAARRNLTRMYVIQKLTHLAAFLLFWRVVMIKSETARRLWYFMFSLIIRAFRLLPIGGRL